jgi:hypothetical protein
MLLENKWQRIFPLEQGLNARSHFLGIIPPHPSMNEEVEFRGGPEAEKC